MPQGDTFIQHPSLKTLFWYWRSLSTEGAVPLRRHIDPVALRGILPHLYILDAGATPDDLRYRLAGSLIVQAFGFEPAGLTRADIRQRHVTIERQADFNQTSLETYRIVSAGVVAYSHDHMTSYTKDYLAYARLNLPISEDGRTLTGVFGAIFMSNDAQPFWRNFTHTHVEIPLSDCLDGI